MSAAKNPIPTSLLGGERRALHDVLLEVAEGTVPAGLRGHYFMVAPAGTLDGSDLGPKIRGDGMVYRFDFSKGAVRVSSALATAPDLLADVATRDRRGPLRFRDVGLGRASPSLGVRNFLNTAFEPLVHPDGGCSLLLTYDAGRPYELDPDTLALATPLGHLDSWRAAGLGGHAFPLVLSPGHPVHDPRTGDLYSASYRPALPGFGYMGFASLMHRAPDGHFTAIGLSTPDGAPLRPEATLHQMAVTRHHVVLLQSAFKIGLDQLVPGRLARRLFGRPQHAHTTLYVVSRRDIDAAHDRGGAVVAYPLRIPMESNHFTADYDSAPDRLVVHLAHNPATDLAEWVRPIDRGAFTNTAAPRRVRGMMAVGAMDVGRVGRYTLDPVRRSVLDARTFADDRLTWALALSAGPGIGTGEPHCEAHGRMFWCTEGLFAELATAHVHRLYRDYPHRLTPMCQLQAIGEGEGRPCTIVGLDARSLCLEDAYVFEPGWVTSSLQYAPGEGGWLVAAVFTPGRNELWVFDAKRIAAGPVCRLHHPSLRFGFSLHTAWLPYLSKARVLPEIHPADDHGPRLRGRAATTLFERSVYPAWDATRSASAPTPLSSRSAKRRSA